MFLRILENPDLGRSKDQPVVVMQLNLGLDMWSFASLWSWGLLISWFQYQDLRCDGIPIDQNPAILLSRLDEHLVVRKEIKNPNKAEHSFFFFFNF